MFLRVLFLTLAAIFLADPAFAYEENTAPDGISEAIPVTLKQLDENPEFYHGKKIKIKGFLARDDLSFRLYVSLENYVALFVYDDEWEITYPVIVEHWPEVFAKNCEEFLSNEKPFYPSAYYNRTIVEIIGTYDLINAGYIPETGQWNVVVGWGAGPRIINVESVEIRERPYISSRTIKKLKVFVDEDETPDLYYEMVSEEDPEYDDLNELLNEFIRAVNARDFQSLRKTVYFSEIDPPHSEKLGNPDYGYSHFLLSDKSLLNKTLTAPVIEGPEFLRPKNYLEEPYNEFSREACFCIDGECQGLWPITLSQLVYPTILDDFICIGLVKTKEGWKWYF